MRLIDADALMEKLRNERNPMGGEDLIDCCDIIRDAPTTGEIVRALIESYDEREHGTATEAYKSIVIRALTEQQKQIAELTERAEQAERERDAAIADMKYGRVCVTCKHDEKCRKEVAATNQTQCIGKQRWEWRGLPQEGEKHNG